MTAVERGRLPVDRLIEARAARRRRSNRIYRIVNQTFFGALLLVVVLGFVKVVALIAPALGWGG